MRSRRVDAADTDMSAVHVPEQLVAQTDMIGREQAICFVALMLDAGERGHECERSMAFLGQSPSHSSTDPHRAGGCTASGAQKVERLVFWKSNPRVTVRAGQGP